MAAENVPDTTAEQQSTSEDRERQSDLCDDQRAPGRTQPTSYSWITALNQSGWVLASGAPCG